MNSLAQLTLKLISLYETLSIRSYALLRKISFLHQHVLLHGFSDLRTQQGKLNLGIRQILKKYLFLHQMDIDK